VMKEHNEFQRWRSKVEKKVWEMNEALKVIQVAIEKQSQKQPVDTSSTSVGDMSAFAHLGVSSIEAMLWQPRHRFVENHQRPGGRIETIQTPPPVGGTTFTPEHPQMFGDWGSLGMNSMGN
jgi:hypothetical protein